MRRPSRLRLRHAAAVDAWMDEPGARVEGHRATVRQQGLALEVVCSCGHAFPAQSSVPGACLTLVRHLEAVVRAGARVRRGGEDGGTAGVREPRRPVPPDGTGTVQLDIT